MLLVVGLGCLTVYGLLAGTGGMPSATAGEYTVTVPTDDLLTVPTTAGGEAAGPVPLVSGSGGGLTGQGGWIGPIGVVIVFGLWLVIAFRIMGPPTVVFVSLLLAGVAAGLLFVGTGGTIAGGESVEQSISVLEQLILLVFAVAVIAAGIGLFLPDDSAVYTTNTRIRQFLLAIVSDVSGRVQSYTSRRHAGASGNEVYRIWWQFTRKVATDTDDVAALTPGELAQRARRAGLPAEAVADLRRVFEHVRYGETPVTEDQVERAVTAWERIQDQGDAHGTHDRDS